MQCSIPKMSDDLADLLLCGKGWLQNIQQLLVYNNEEGLTIFFTNFNIGD